MKNYMIKMAVVVLIISSILCYMKEKNRKVVKNIVVNNIVYKSDIAYNRYEDMIVYEGLTLKELGLKIDKQFNSTLDGYGQTFASLAIDAGVDPVVSAAIVLLETGCKWNCSSLVTSCNNIGGMRGGSCNGYAKYNSLDEGMKAFINNLKYNYFSKGLTTTKLINTKYAENPNWYKKVDYYVKAINNS